MDYHIEEKESFAVSGPFYPANAQTDYLGLWQDYLEENPEAGLTYGYTYEIKEYGAVIYQLGQVVAVDQAEAKVVPASKYVVIDLEGPAGFSLAMAYGYFFDEVCPQEGIAEDYKWSVEVYPAGDRTAMDYQMQLWLAVEWFLNDDSSLEKVEWFGWKIFEFLQSGMNLLQKIRV